MINGGVMKRHMKRSPLSFLALPALLLAGGCQKSLPIEAMASADGFITARNSSWFQKGCITSVTVAALSTPSASWDESRQLLQWKSNNACDSVVKLDARSIMKRSADGKWALPKGDYRVIAKGPDGAGGSAHFQVR